MSEKLPRAPQYCSRNEDANDISRGPFILKITFFAWVLSTFMLYSSKSSFISKEPEKDIPLNN